MKKSTTTLLSLAFICLGIFGFSKYGVAQLDSNDFVTTWETDYPGNSNDSSITLAVPSWAYTYNYDVDWDNDGVFDQFGLTTSVTHQYATPGTYTIRIRGTFPVINFSAGPSSDEDKLISVDQWVVRYGGL